MMKYGLMCDLSETEGLQMSGSDVRATSHVWTPGQWPDARPVGADGQQSPNIEQRAGPSFCSEEGRDTHCSRGGVLTNKRKQHNVTVETGEGGRCFYSMAQNNGLRAPSAEESALSRIKQNNRNNFLVFNINS